MFLGRISTCYLSLRDRPGKAQVSQARPHFWLPHLWSQACRTNARECGREIGPRARGGAFLDRRPHAASKVRELAEQAPVAAPHRPHRGSAVLPTVLGLLGRAKRGGALSSCEQPRLPPFAGLPQRPWAFRDVAALSLHWWCVGCLCGRSGPRGRARHQGSEVPYRFIVPKGVLRTSEDREKLTCICR